MQIHERREGEDMLKTPKEITEQRIAELILQCEAKHGKGIICKADEIPEIPRTSTGLPELDAIIGGGIPAGRLIEFFGVESSGKTSIACNIMAQYTAAKRFVLFIDAEGTYDMPFATKIGVDHTYFRKMNPEYGEQAIEWIVKFADAGMPLIVVDSVPALIPKVVRDRTDYDKQAGVASTARLLSETLSLIVSKCGISRTSVIFINQVRTEIGKMYGDPFQAPGGRALKHFTSLRLRVTKTEAIEDKIGTQKLDLGQICRVKVIKSKVSEPRRECTLPLIYTGKRQGFFKHEELPDVIDEIRESLGYKKKRRKMQGEESEGEEEDAA